MSTPDDRGLSISESSSVDEIAQILSSADRSRRLSLVDLHVAAELAWRQNRFDLGIVAMKLYVERQPQDARLRHRLANFLYQAGDAREAEAECEKAIQLEPEFEGTYLTLRHIRTNQGNYEGAAEAARMQEQNCGSSPELSFDVAHLLVHAGKLEEALATIRRVNDIGPLIERNLLLEAEIAQRLDMTHASTSAAERAHRLWPDSATASMMLARLLFHIGQYRLAVPVLQKARALLPHDAMPCHMLAVALMVTGDFRAALNAALEAVAINPNEYEYLYVTASLHDRLGEGEQALEYMRRVIAVAPDRPQPRVTLAHMLSRSGHTDQAIDALKDAERLDPENVSIRDLRLSWQGQHLPALRTLGGAGGSNLFPPMPKAPRPSDRKGPLLSFLRGVATQSRVVFSLVMREFRHRAAHSRFGLLTVFIPVVLQIVTLGIVLSIFNNGMAPIGQHLFFFYATGVMPFYLFIHVVDHSQNLFLDNTKVLQVPIISRLDLILAASITELLIIIATVVVTFGIFALVSYGPSSDNQIQAVFAMLAVWLFAFGLGLICAVMINLYRPFAHGWLILQRFLYFISGVFFIPLQMPAWIREPLSWNPLLQGIEWFRTGFFMRYDPPWLDKSYLVGIGFATTIVGLMLERALRRKMKAV